MSTSGVQIVVSVLLALVTTCQGHVSLVYPPARTYAIDFLNSARTVPPCGMARGLSLAFLCLYANRVLPLSMLTTVCHAVVVSAAHKYSSAATDVNIWYTCRMFSYKFLAPNHRSMQLVNTALTRHLSR